MLFFSATLAAENWSFSSSPRGPRSAQTPAAGKRLPAPNPRFRVRSLEQGGSVEPVYLAQPDLAGLLLRLPFFEKQTEGSKILGKMGITVAGLEAHYGH